MSGPESWIALAAAIALDAYLGASLGAGAGRWHPKALIGRTLAWSEARLNRPQRSARDRRLRGALALAAAVIAAVVAGAALAGLARAAPIVWVPLALLACALIDLRTEHEDARALAAALASGDGAAAHARLARLSARDPAALDAYGVARAGIEGVLARFASGWLGPVAAWAALGPAGLLGYWVVAVAGERLGGRAQRLADFGAASRAAARGLATVTDRLAGLVLVAGAVPSAGADAAAAWRTLRGQRAAWTVAAAAGALGLALGGPRRYPARTVQAPWIGAGRARAGADDILGALALVRAGALVSFALVVLAAAASAA